MKKNILLLLTFMLLACTPQVTVTSEATVTLPSPTQTPTLIPTPTEIPLESLPIEELAQKYLAGEIDDISFLSLEKANEVRTAIVKQLNADGGVHVTFDENSSNPAYLSPKDFTLHQLGDGLSEAEQSIHLNAEIKVDAEGYVWVENLQGELMKIDGSVGVDWNEVITDPNSTSIDWPTTKPGNTGFPDAQWFLTLSDSPAYQRAILLDKTVGNFFLKELSGGRMVETLRFYKIVTDKDGNPLYARIFLAAPAGEIGYFEEGSNAEGRSRNIRIQSTSMYDLLRENSVYLAGIKTNQATITDYPNSSSGYEGVVPETNSGDVLLGNETDQENLLFILMRMLIKTQP